MSFSEYQCRCFVAAAEAAAPGCPTAGTFAVQLFGWSVQSLHRGMPRPFLTHTKAALDRGRKHRNTTRELLRRFIALGIVRVHDPFRSAEEIAAAVAAGARGYAPGFDPSAHHTKYSIDWGKVMKIAAACKSSPSRAMEAFREARRRWKRRRRDAREAAASGAAARAIVLQQLQKLSRQRKGEPFTDALRNSLTLS